MHCAESQKKNINGNCRQQTHTDYGLLISRRLQRGILFTIEIFLMRNTGGRNNNRFAWCDRPGKTAKTGEIMLSDFDLEGKNKIQKAVYYLKYYGLLYTFKKILKKLGISIRE